MGWHYRLPSQFPATYLSGLREAKANSPDRIILGQFSRSYEAKALAEQFRWFRWCVRERPDAAKDLSTILEDYDVRTSIESSDIFGYILYVTAKPTKISEFVRLNPQLAESIEEEI